MNWNTIKYLYNCSHKLFSLYPHPTSQNSLEDWPIPVSYILTETGHLKPVNSFNVIILSTIPACALPWSHEKNLWKDTLHICKLPHFCRQQTFVHSLQMSCCPASLVTPDLGWLTGQRGLKQENYQTPSSRWFLGLTPPRTPTYSLQGIVSLQNKLNTQNKKATTQNVCKWKHITSTNKQWTIQANHAVKCLK